MRFVPAAAEPYLAGTDEPSGPARRRAVATLLGAYTDGRRLLTGLGLWLGVVGGVAAAVVGVVAIGATVVDGEPAGSALLGAIAVLAGVAGGTWAARRGTELLRAGARLSRAAESWMVATPDAPASFGRQLHALLSTLRPELLPRVLLSSLAGLLAVLALCAVGFGIWRLAGATGGEVVVGVVLSAASAVLAAVSAVPAVALWRGSRRIQRGLVADPAVRR
ncbi:hypothetical protein [Georgenia sp. H159]|uniref:hypothetical protein n=1 Tax=Georgenia sp. H159 TaxID=3076115 RepID=UPI002D76E03E|nr:hypothetical protein [Georgenia sp. H159]